MRVRCEQGDKRLGRCKIQTLIGRPRGNRIDVGLKAVGYLVNRHCEFTKIVVVGKDVINFSVVSAVRDKEDVQDLQDHLADIHDHLDEFDEGLEEFDNLDEGLEEFENYDEGFEDFEFDEDYLDVEIFEEDFLYGYSSSEEI